MLHTQSSENIGPTRAWPTKIEGNGAENRELRHIFVEFGRIGDFLARLEVSRC